MGKHFQSGLLAGTTAAVIWIAASMWAGFDTKAIGMWAIAFLVGTCLLATIGASLGSKASNAVHDEMTRPGR